MRSNLSSPWPGNSGNSIPHLVNGCYFLRAQKESETGIIAWVTRMALLAETYGPEGTGCRAPAMKTASLRALHTAARFFMAQSLGADSNIHTRVKG